MVEVAGIELAPPNYLQDYEIISFYRTLKSTNRPGFSIIITIRILKQCMISRISVVLNGKILKFRFIEDNVSGFKFVKNEIFC